MVDNFDIDPHAKRPKTGPNFSGRNLFGPLDKGPYISPRTPVAKIVNALVNDGVGTYGPVLNTLAAQAFDQQIQRDRLSLFQPRGPTHPPDPDERVVLELRGLRSKLDALVKYFGIEHVAER